jgi:L-lactate dehydrogenase complex protein LldG
MTAREEVLSRVRFALAAPTPTQPTRVVRAYRTAESHPPGHPALIRLLVDRLDDYRAQVSLCFADTVPDAVASALQGSQRVVVPAGLNPSWIPTSLTPLRDVALDAHSLDHIDAAITGAAVAIAETGTIVLDGSADQGRRALTLVPDLHICVIHADQIVSSVPQAIALLSPTRPQTWISGPSATSDIELERVEGVHGPRTVHVVIVRGSKEHDLDRSTTS